MDPLPLQDAYGLGMGGADTALVGGTHAVESNPAGLAQASVPMAQLGLGLDSPSGTFDLNTTVLYPLPDGTVFALSQFSGFYSGNTDTAVVGSAALPLDSARDLSLGLNLKYLTLSNPANPVEGSGRGFGLDLGFNYNLRDEKGVVASFGLAVKDLSSVVRFSNTGEESVTRTFDLGAAYDGMTDTRFELDADFVDRTLSGTALHDHFNLGAERFFQDRNFSVRAGYQDLFQSDGAFSLGAGYHPAQPFEITYALSVSSDLSRAANFLTFVYRLDDWNKNRTEKAEAGGEITLGPAPEETPAFIPRTGRPVSGVPLRKMQVAASPALIPDTGAQPARITFPGNHPDDIAGWELSVQDDKGKTLRRLDGTGKPLPALEWDGTDDAGRPLAPGAYQVRLRTFNAANDLLSDDSTPVRIAASRSQVGMSVSSPYLSLARGRRNASLTFTPELGASDAAKTWEFRVEDGKTHEVVYDRKGVRKVPATLRWNGRTAKAVPAPDGPYEAVLSLVDLLGETLQSDPVPVTLASAPPRLSVTADDHWLDLGKTSQFKFRLSAEDPVGFQDWSLKLLADDGGVVRTFLGQSEVPAQLTWDGKDDAGDRVADGSFLRAQFTAQDKAGNQASPDDFPLQVEASVPADQASLSLNLTTVYFAPGSSTLDAASRKELQKAGQSIKPYLDKSVFVIKGYAAADEPGDGVALSHARARQVRDYLVKSFGIPEAKVFALGYAGRDPLTGDGAADKQRRVTVTIDTQP